MNEPAPALERQGDPNIAKIIYVLYLLGLLTGVTIIVGVVMAYIYRDDAPEWLKTHYTLQIRTFWIGLLYSFISGLLFAVLIGFLLLFLVALWWIVRNVKGLKHLESRSPYPDYLGWAL